MAYKVVTRAPTAKDMASIVAEKLGDKTLAKQGVDATVMAMQEMLTSQGCIHLPGFGRFSLRKVRAHNGRNPQTGQTMTIAACKKVSFSMSKAWKHKVNPQLVKT